MSVAIAVCFLLAAAGLLVDMWCQIAADGFADRPIDMVLAPPRRRMSMTPVYGSQRFMWTRPDWADRARLARLYTWPAQIEAPRWELVAAP